LNLNLMPLCQELNVKYTCIAWPGSCYIDL